MKINIACISRSLIALLFVVAGLQKLTHFQETVASIQAIDIPLAGLVAIIVIIIEIPVAVMFAWGYKTHITGGILMLFTLIVTVLVHGKLGVGMNMVMALKNLAIIGGILALSNIPAGFCGVCKNGNCEKHSK
jgi:putative oxidoreductase